MEKSERKLLYSNKGTILCPQTIDRYLFLSGVGKIQEKLVFKHIYNHNNDNNLLYKYQFSFIPSHSTTFKLLEIYHHICKSFDNNQYSCMVFCDLSKAFDRVWHKGLIFN